VRRRLGCWVIVAVVAAGCATPAANKPTAADQTDVWFMQHMVPHLRQTTSIVELARDRITRPELARLADTIGQQGQTHLQQLQGWLDRRGLAPHGHSHQGIDNRRRNDLERLSRVPGTTFDLAFLKMMTARQRTGSKLAATEARDGSLSEVRQLARQMMAERRAQVRQMDAWKKLWSPAGSSRLAARRGVSPSTYLGC
jgi:uncharacterized protein (DUF305 family)